MKTFFFFFLESTCALCPWSLALASSIPVLGLESVCPRKGCPWPWPWPRIFFVSLALALASSLMSSTPPLATTTALHCKTMAIYHAARHGAVGLTAYAARLPSLPRRASICKDKICFKNFDNLLALRLDLYRKKKVFTLLVPRTLKDSHRSR